MAGYTTVEKFKAAFGGDRTRAAMPEWNALDSTVRLDEAILSVSAYIDSYLSEGGFATPVVFANITDADASARLEALLSDVCIAILAGRILPVATRGTGRGGEKNANWAQAWLERVARGSVSLPGMPVKATSRLRVIGDNEPALSNELFDTYRWI